MRERRAPISHSTTRCGSVDDPVTACSLCALDPTRVDRRFWRSGELALLPALAHRLSQWPAAGCGGSTLMKWTSNPVDVSLELGQGVQSGLAPAGRTRPPRSGRVSDTAPAARPDTTSTGLSAVSALAVPVRGECRCRCCRSKGPAGLRRWCRWPGRTALRQPGAWPGPRTPGPCRPG